ncbi:MAG: peptide ABC transporter substrate-binding protein [Acaryochloris sp. RU_4_1]|nr:peptide ABC transporter substrate-binding protein [Acaryochloris sp. SU_5_25]NJM64726.1 peptide ABC transporter substrate-binding protein [Acaryochloris sp. RU_4_1]NJR53946.1 peptide ABC transporter substrate-binding protein [Acaryochloris sp. CRU_2_0]
MLVIGCRPTPSGPTTAGSDSRLAIGTTAKIRTLDPADALELFAGNLLYNMGDRLYTYKSGTTDLVPQLATELPKVSEDGLVYTISVRTGVIFHDGTPFDAKAMAFSLNRFIKNGGQPAFLLADSLASVEAKSAKELVITLKKPFAAFSDLLAFSGLVAVSPKAYAIGPGEFQPSQFIGTGPYKLTSFGSDSIRLERFDQYWGEQPQNPGIDIQTFSSPANLFNAFRTGSIDIAYQSLNPDQIDALTKVGNKDDWQAITGSGSNITYLSLNLRNEAFKQPAVRQALAISINRKLIQERVFNGQVEPLYSLVPSIFEVSKPIFEPTSGDVDVAKAKELLQKAGYTNNKPLQIDFWYRSNVPTDGPAATVIKAFIEQELEGLIKVDLSSIESATAYNNLAKGTYPMFMLDWSGDYYDPDTYLHPFLDCAKGSVAQGCQDGATVSQGSFYYSQKMNQLIDQQRQEQDPAKRQQIVAGIQDLLAEDVPFIPLWQRKEYAFAQRDIQGVRLEPTQAMPFWSLSRS